MATSQMNGMFLWKPKISMGFQSYLTYPLVMSKNAIEAMAQSK